MAPLLSIFVDGRWVFSNHNTLLMLVTLVDNAFDDLSVISERSRENAVVSMMGGGV